MALIFPNVPSNIGGVPAINVKPGAVPFEPGRGILTQDDQTTKATDKAAWGIYTKDGELLLEPDTIKALEPSREFRVLDYPIENGDFQSYNKVATPAETRITLTKGGSETDRKAFLDALDAAIATTDLYSIVTPDQTYMDRTISRYDFRRTAENGATLLSVDITTTEVRQTATSSTSNSKEPSGEDAASSGPLRPQKPTAAQMPSPSLISRYAAVNDIPALELSAKRAEINQTVSRVVGAGGGLGDLVAKNVPISTIPLASRSAQSLAATLGGQAVRMVVKEKAFGTFVDVLVNEAPVAMGVLARNGAPLVRADYLGFAGELFFHDTQGNSDPSPGGFGSRFAMLYAGA